MITMENVTPILRGALFGALAALLLLAEPAPGSAQSGAGTEWVKCRDRAWADYNTCLVENKSLGGHIMCFFAWDIDNVYCDTKLLKDLM